MTCTTHDPRTRCSVKTRTGHTLQAAGQPLRTGRLRRRLTAPDALSPRWPSGLSRRVTPHPHTQLTHYTAPAPLTPAPTTGRSTHPLWRAHRGWNGTGNEITPTTSNACPCAAAAARSSTASWIPYPAHAPFQPPRWWTPGEPLSVRTAYFQLYLQTMHELQCIRPRVGKGSVLITK